ncbi:MAG: hypothetical protein WBA97_19160 [Actinophytocola sp.]|uniref:hypothetical protein n=1 Tax=Actinophytocola sp. TaxID=1872138 RepID=UPI003C760AFA
MATWRQSGLALVFVGVVTLTGCQTAGTGDDSAASSTAATSSTRTSVSAPPGTTCANVVTQGQTFGTVVGEFVGGSATIDQVRSAATDLSDALTEAGSSAKADAAAAFDDVNAELDQLLTALQAQPVDREGVRTASIGVLSGLGDAVALCEPAPTSS